MSNERLHPPNTDSLSENVIGAVVARLTHPTTYRYDHLPVHTTHHHQAATTTDHQLDQWLGNQHIFATLSSRNINDQATNGMSTAERLIMLHRQRRTRTQQRYRKKINDKVIALEDSVIELKDEIEQLKKQRELSTPLYSLSKTTSWKMVVEYVRLFRYGYQHPTLIAHSDGTTTLSTTDSNNMQKTFLQAVMMPDIAFNGGRQGVDAVFEDWKTISQHHENTETQLTCLECGEGGLLVAHMNNVSTITAKMIRNHLLDDEYSEWPSLARKLLGQSLVIPTIVRYEWDELNSRFASVYYEPDMLTPLLGLLGNLEEATRVVNTALGNHCKL